jgi:hypothetical protein
VKVLVEETYVCRIELNLTVWVNVLVKEKCVLRAFRVWVNVLVKEKCV